MVNFSVQLRNFEEKVKNRGRIVSKQFKLDMFDRIVAGTRIARPETWKRPDFSHIPGAMRGNWKVTDGPTLFPFNPQERNVSFSLPADERAKVQAFANTRLTNNTPYVLVYEMKDAMVGRAVAAANEVLSAAVQQAKAQTGGR